MTPTPIAGIITVEGVAAINGRGGTAAMDTEHDDSEEMQYNDENNPYELLMSDMLVPQSLSDNTGAVDIEDEEEVAPDYDILEEV